MDGAAREHLLLEAAEQLAEIGSWEWRPETGELLWSRNMMRIFGLDPAAEVPSLDRIVEFTHPDDRELQAREIARLRAGATDQSFAFRVIHPDGTVRHLHATLVATGSEDGEPRRVLGCVFDLTSKRIAEREIAVHLAASEALNGAGDSPAPRAEVLLRGLARALECEYATLWVPGDEGLVARASWESAVLTPTALELARDRFRDRPAGMPVVEALASRHPVFHNAADSNGSQSNGNEPGVAGALAFPVLTGSEVLAVFEFRSREAIQLTERFVRSLIGVGHELGAYFAHHTTELRSPSLTPRELEILRQAADGASGPAIARALEISPATVKTHFEHVYEKLGVSDRASAVAVALRGGLFE